MRTDYSIKNSILSVIDNILTILLLFISQTLFIKIMGVEYLGLNGLFTNILTILNLVELGIGNAITFVLYKYVEKNDKEKIKSIMFFFKKAYNIITIIVLLLGLSITFFIPYLIKEVNVDINIYIIYILFLLSTVCTYIMSYKRNLIYANQKNYIIKTFSILYTFVLSVAQLIIIYITKNYYLYLVVKIICNLLENLLIDIKANKMYPYLKEKNIKPLGQKIKKSIISRVKALVIHKTSASITNGTDNILISYFFGITTVGLYTTYNYIFKTIDKISKGIIESAGASIGNLLVCENNSKRYIVFNRIRFLNICIALITASCLLVLTEPFITLWVGKDYLLSSIVLYVLIINYIQSMMRSTYSLFKEAAGIWIEDKYIPILQSSINLISSIILLKLIGLPGVFIGTVISSLVLWLYSYPKYVYKKLLNASYKEYVFNIMKSVLLFSIVIITTYYISSLIIINNMILNLLVKLIISSLIPVISIIIIYRKNDNLLFYKGLFIKYIKER